MSICKSAISSLILIVLSACAGDEDVRHMGDLVTRELNLAPDEDFHLPPIRHNRILKKLFDQFIEDAYKEGIVIPQGVIDRIRVIDFVEKFSYSGTEPGTLAKCESFSASKSLPGGGTEIKRWKNIEVLRSSRSQFAGRDHVRLRELVAHEAFHCLFGKGHLPEDVSGVMHPNLTLGSDRIYTDRKGLWKEMFSPTMMNLCPDVDN